LGFGKQRGVATVKNKVRNPQQLMVLMRQYCEKNDIVSFVDQLSFEEITLCTAVSECLLSDPNLSHLERTEREHQFDFFNRLRKSRIEVN
jgi:hypothetical protein